MCEVPKAWFSAHKCESGGCTQPLWFDLHGTNSVPSRDWIVKFIISHAWCDLSSISGLADV